jgi:hypothetical protein
MVFVLVFSINGQQTFPESRGSNVLVRGVWIASPIVVVGEMVNLRPYGEQDVAHLPWPMSSEVHKLYWCEGELRAVAVVER